MRSMSSSGRRCRRNGSRAWRWRSFARARSSRREDTAWRTSSTRSPSPTRRSSVGIIGKQFTAAAVMLQVEDGKIALDDPITKFFPDAPRRGGHHGASSADAHVRNPRLHRRQARLRRDYTEDELVEFAQTLELDFAPGRRMEIQQHRLCRCSARSCASVGRVLRRRAARARVRAARHEDRTRDQRGRHRRRIAPPGIGSQQDKLQNQEWVSPALNTTADGSLYLSLRDLIAWDRGLRARPV